LIIATVRNGRPRHLDNTLLLPPTHYVYSIKQGNELIEFDYVSKEERKEKGERRKEKRERRKEKGERRKEKGERRNVGKTIKSDLLFPWSPASICHSTRP